MYLTVAQKDLKAAVTAVQTIASGKALLPILHHLVLVADATGLTLRASNDESSLCYRVPATVQATGTTLLPARLFAGFVQDLPAAPITLIAPSPTDATAVQVRCQQVKAHLKQTALSIEEFPRMPAFAQRSRDVLTLDCELLREIIEQVAFAAATDSSRPILQGVRLAVQGGQASVSAANAFRLAVRTLAVPDPTATAEVIVSAHTLRQMAHLLPTSGAVHLALSAQGNQALFHTAVMDLATRVIAGTFPDFRSLLTLVPATRVVLPTRALASAVHLMRPFARENAHLLHLQVQQEHAGEAAALVLEAHAADLGANEIRLADAVTVEGGDLSIQVNESWLAEALAAVPTPQVSLAFTSERQPLVIRPVGPLDAVSVLMPMLRNEPSTSARAGASVSAATVTR